MVKEKLSRSRELASKVIFAALRIGKIQAWRDGMGTGKLSWIKQVSINEYCFDPSGWAYLLLAIPLIDHDC
ncbi:hypothetical protein BCL69_107113 [Nitrosomonas communis]|uniref:Uncharacterized protein n=2 Tax=Nitrosomonadaceae TaxID=206379 RepID=A0A0F7KH37_9PROT|nr:hypothetical protein AAW31_10540 [Nitrosomonas communis]TYP78556.1 hypothetical protein BCL69_107113 [Nitrosomonas communis]